MRSPDKERIRPQQEADSRSSTAIKTSTPSLTPPAAEVAARRRWAYSLIRRASTPVPSYGSAEWLQLPDGTAAKVAAVVVAAESWARELDDLPDRLERELDERRRAEKAAEDAEYQARAAAHRRDWGHLRVVETSYAERRVRELAAAGRAKIDSRRKAES